MKRLMTDRSRLGILCPPAMLLCVANFAISPEVSAKPNQDRGPGNGKALGKFKKTQKNSPPTLSGTPDGTVLENSYYDFVPGASDPDSEVNTTMNNGS